MEKIELKNPFKSYLDERKETPWAFAQRTNISQPTVYRAYNGRRIYKKTAYAICRATRWELKLWHFGY